MPSSDKKDKKTRKDKTVVANSFRGAGAGAVTGTARVLEPREKRSKKKSDKTERD